MYCFIGNITFHRSEHSYHDKNDHQIEDLARSIMVLSYADQDGFMHDECRVANDACNYLTQD